MESHSAFLADAFSPAVECQYQSKRGSCVFQVATSNTRIWPVRADACSAVQSCQIVFVSGLGRKQLGVGIRIVSVRC